MRRVLAVLFSLLVFLVPAAEAQRRRTIGGTPRIVVGGLFSLTGDGATLGKASEAALQLAARDINAELTALRVPYRVQTVVANSHLTQEGAMEGIAMLAAQGASIVIGPQSSAEAGAIREYANSHHIVLISQASTAFSLAIPNDYLFRLAPNDRLEGAAVAALMRADGVDVVVPVWRNDAGNTGLKDGMAQFFTAAGGIVGPGISYAPDATAFTATVATLGDVVRAAKSGYPGKKIAVYIASFEEGVDLLDRARLDPDLVRNWYSGDGLTQSQAVIANGAVAAFAATTKLSAPAVTLSEQTRDRWEPLSAEIEAQVGFKPDAFSLSVYDAAWAAVLSAVEVRNADDLLRDAFVRNVQRYWGVTGPLALDAAGDRRVADFDFWTVTASGWTRTASYVSGRLVH